MTRPGFPAPPDGGWLDGDATRAVRPYAATGGRTSPPVAVDLLSMIVAAGHAAVAGLGPDHEQILGICRQPASVAEVAALLRLPVVVVKILVGDLIERGAVRVSAPLTASAAGTSGRELLERVLHGLQTVL